MAREIADYCPAPPPANDLISGTLTGAPVDIGAGVAGTAPSSARIMGGAIDRLAGRPQTGGAPPFGSPPRPTRPSSITGGTDTVVLPPTTALALRARAAGESRLLFSRLPEGATARLDCTNLVCGDRFVGVTVERDDQPEISG